MFQWITAFAVSDMRVNSKKSIYFFVFLQWGSSVFLCYKKSVSASNSINYKAGKSDNFF